MIIQNHPTRSPNREAHERFVHLRNCNQSYPNGRAVTDVTAFVRTKDGVDYVSFAEKDVRDQFCRRTGRVIARRKWFNGKRVVLPAAARVGFSIGDSGTEGIFSDTLYDRVLETYYDTAGGE